MSDLIISWYVKYLNRHPAAAEIAYWVSVITAGYLTVLQAEAEIIGSDEFYILNGNTPYGFVQGLYLKVNSNFTLTIENRTLAALQLLTGE